MLRLYVHCLSRSIRNLIYSTYISLTKSSNLKHIHAVVHLVSISLIEGDFEQVMRSLFCYYSALTALQAGRSWVRIPDGVIGIFHCYNSSGRTMTLGFTQPLTEMSTRNIS